MAANTEIARLDSIPAETLNKMISGADNQLPKVTSSDNGKVLVVSSGKWAKGEAPSGGGVLAVNVNAQGVLDKTWQEIHDADLAVIKVEANGAHNTLQVEYTMEDQDEYVVGAYFGDTVYTYKTNSSDGYPAYEEAPI